MTQRRSASPSHRCLNNDCAPRVQIRSQRVAVAAGQALVGVLACCGHSRLGSAGGTRVTKASIPSARAYQPRAANNIPTMKKLDAPRPPHCGSLARARCWNCFAPHSLATRGRQPAPPITACYGASGPITVGAEAVRMRPEQPLTKQARPEGPSARHSFPRRRQSRIAHQSFRRLAASPALRAFCVENRPVRAQLLRWLASVASFLQFRVAGVV
jgi:hypothetical protein